jgi:23S rRNA (pseudouridine1915-N3)-methyltransferase
MKMSVLAIGKMRQGPEKQLFHHYFQRCQAIGPSLGVPSFDVIELGESRARSASQRKKEEADQLRARIQTPAACVVALDEKGKTLSTLALTEKIEYYRCETSHLYWVIGGADGLCPEFRKSANLRLAFGALTWPHQLVRIMLAEQIYRVLTVLAGHPYHREG